MNTTIRCNCCGAEADTVTLPGPMTETRLQTFQLDSGVLEAWVVATIFLCPKCVAQAVHKKLLSSLENTP